MRIYNYKFEKKDARDEKLKFSGPKIPLPTKYMCENLPPVLDQGSLGSCTANAASNALRFCLKHENDFQPSRLFIYYFSRLIEHTVEEDSGACIRDVMKAIARYGSCSSKDWPYDIAKFKQKPPQQCVDLAKKHKDFKYLKISQTETDLKTALVKQFPIICGVVVYSSFESEEALKTGHIPMPDLETETVLGGHCILLVGYDDEKREFKFQNSWGCNVGDNGFFYLPYDFVLNPNLTNDFWVITQFS